MVLAALAFPVLLIVSNTPLYIPSAALQEAARSAGPPAPVQQSLARLLRYCTGRRQRYRFNDVGLRFQVLHSWRNDAGWLATTHVDCRFDDRCVVQASAWIASPQQGGRCDW